MLLSQMLRNISDIPSDSRMMDTCKDILVNILDEYISDEGDHEFTKDDLDSLSETFAHCFDEDASETLSDCERFISKLASGEVFDENDYIDYSETQRDYEEIEDENEEYHVRESEDEMLNENNYEEESDSFTIIIGNNEKKIKVRKVGNKWRSSDGKSFMGYLKPQDVIMWIRSDYCKYGEPYSIQWD